MLEIDWVFPVWKPEQAEQKEGGATTVSTQREHALPIEQAYAWIADGDKRPLLVLRECDRCKGTDHALLTRTMDGEKTALLTHWFRCVKLPTNVLETDHPFAALFARSKDGERIPHLFFCDADGSNRTPLPGDQSQSDTWKVMFSYLERCYEGDASKSLKEMMGLLSQFDRIDNRERDIKGRMDQEAEKRGPDSERLDKYEAELEKLAKEREKLLAREREIRTLALKQLSENPLPETGAK